MLFETRSCGIETLSNLAPHLEQLHMLALWGRLWGKLSLVMAENHIKTNISGLQYLKYTVLHQQCHLVSPANAQEKLNIRPSE